MLALPGVVTATEVHGRPRARPEHREVLPGRHLRRRDGGGRAARRRSPTSGSCRPAASARRTSPSTSRCPPCSRSAARGWFRRRPRPRGRLRRRHATSRPRRSASSRSPEPPDARRSARSCPTWSSAPRPRRRYDVVSLGEVMLRLDPGEGRIRTARAFRRLGRRRRVQRGPRPAPLLRPAHRRRHRARGQRGRPPGRGPHPAGRRRHLARPVGALRRRRPHGPQRPELHRARLRRARRRRASRPRPHRGRASSSPATSTGTHLFGEHGRALVPHRRHLRGAVRQRGRDRDRGGAGRRASTARSSPTTSTTARACGRRIGGQASARRRSTAAIAPYVDVMIGNEEDFTASPRLRGRGRRREPQRARAGRVQGDDRPRGARRTRTSRSSRPRCARCTSRDRQRLGRDRLVRGHRSTSARRTASAWRSSTASAAATASRPA